MVETTHHTVDFYKYLASLFYAVAAVDHNVVIAEKRKIKELVDENWSFKSGDIDSQEVIFSTLKKLITDNYDKEVAFLDFKNFFLKHPEEFPTHIRTKILDDADSITVAYARRNKSESVLISRLYFLLRE